MRIPKKVKIGGITYKVVEAERWIGCDDPTDGMVDDTTNTIYINKRLSPQAKDVTLIHEALHCMNSTMNHEALDSLAEQIYQCFSDNKLLK